MEGAPSPAGKRAAGLGPGPSPSVVAARAAGYIALRYVLYAFSVAMLLYLTAAAISLIPFLTITTTPETEVINKVGLDLQSLKYILFESELSQLYAPSPPPAAR